LGDCTLGPVLMGLVGGGLVARKIAGFEGILKVFCEPAGLGLGRFDFQWSSGRC